MFDIFFHFQIFHKKTPFLENLHFAIAMVIIQIFKEKGKLTIISARLPQSPRFGRHFHSPSLATPEDKYERPHAEDEPQL